MEIILAIVVASAVIFFGALISMGNERQRKAIDGLREQVVLWAVQDLKIKLRHLEQTAQVPDPLDWLNKVATKISGNDLKLEIIEISESPQCITCVSEDGAKKVFFTPHSPSDISKMKRAKLNRLSKFTSKQKLLSLSRHVETYECSVLNNGVLFDRELSLTWKALTGIDINEKSNLWIYVNS